MPKCAADFSRAERDKLVRFAVAILRTEPDLPAQQTFMLAVSRAVGEPLGEPITKRFAVSLLKEAESHLRIMEVMSLEKWQSTLMDIHQHCVREQMPDVEAFARSELEKVQARLEKLKGKGMDAGQTEAEKAEIQKPETQAESSDPGAQRQQAVDYGHEGDVRA